MIRAVTKAQVSDDRSNRTTVIASTNELARDGHIVEPAGLDTTNFLRTGTIFFNHDTSMPVGKPVSAMPTADGSKLQVEVEWAPPGISETADEVRGLVKAGIIRAVSIGFMPTRTEPLDPKRPYDGQHILEGDLLELSFVGVPADTGAVVTQRSYAREHRASQVLARHVPVGLLSPRERWELDKQRCLQTYAIGLARQEEDAARYSKDARRARFEALRNRD
jgi:HK97 family phage prohead protease